MPREEAVSKLFVGNLPFKVTDADLQNWFESNGYSVESAQIITDHKTGRSRGTGFVMLKRNDQLKDAVDKLNGQNRPLWKRRWIFEKVIPSASSKFRGSAFP